MSLCLMNHRLSVVYTLCHSHLPSVSLHSPSSMWGHIHTYARARTHACTHAHIPSLSLSIHFPIWLSICTPPNLFISQSLYLPISLSPNLFISQSLYLPIFFHLQSCGMSCHRHYQSGHAGIPVLTAGARWLYMGTQFQLGEHTVQRRFRA